MVHSTLHIMFDLISIIIGGIAVLYSFAVYKSVNPKDNLKRITLLLFLGIFSIFIYKLIETFIGDFDLIDHFILETIERIAFLSTILFLIIAAKLSKQVLRELDLKKRIKAKRKH